MGRKRRRRRWENDLTAPIRFRIKAYREAKAAGAPDDMAREYAEQRVRVLLSEYGAYRSMIETVRERFLGPRGIPFALWDRYLDFCDDFWELRRKGLTRDKEMIIYLIKKWARRGLDPEVLCDLVKGIFWMYIPIDAKAEVAKAMEDLLKQLKPRVDGKAGVQHQHGQDDPESGRK